MRCLFKDRIQLDDMPFIERRTQIIPLEGLAVWISIQVWKSGLACTKLILFVDNQSILGALKKGRSKASDIHNIVQNITDALEDIHCRPFFFWVPSSLNVADIPSRGKSPSTILPRVVEVDSRKHTLSIQEAVFQGKY